MLNRIIIAIIFIPIFIFIIAFGGILFFLACELIIGVMLYEFYRMLENANIKVFKKTGIFLGLLYPLIYFLDIQLGSLKYERLMYFFIFVCFVWLAIRKLIQDSPEEGLREIAFTLFGIIYIVYLFTFLLRMTHFADGQLWIFTTFFGVWVSDSAAYFIGKKFGKHKLVPHTSPKKSVEGFIAAVFFPILLMVLLKYIFFANLHLTWVFIIFLGIGIGIAGQVGDLTESLIKRDLKVKDSGTILQDHGGFLDRFDSILFVAPLIFYFVKLFIH